MIRKFLVIAIVIAIAGGSMWYFTNAWKWDGMAEVQGFVLDQAGDPVVGLSVKVRLETPDGTSWTVCDTVKTDDNGWYHLMWSLIPPSGQQTPGLVDCSLMNQEGPYVLWIIDGRILVELSPRPADDIRVRQDIRTG